MTAKDDGKAGKVTAKSDGNPGPAGDLPEESIASGEEGGTSNPPLTQKLRILKGLMALQK